MSFMEQTAGSADISKIVTASRYSLFPVDLRSMEHPINYNITLYTCFVIFIVVLYIYIYYQL